MIQISCAGNLTYDVDEKKNKDDQSFYCFTVAVNLSKDKAVFVKCAVNYAPGFLQYLKKGCMVFVTGTFSNIYTPTTDGHDPQLQLRVSQIKILSFAKDGASTDQRQQQKVDQHNQNLKSGERYIDRGYQVQGNSGLPF